MAKYWGKLYLIDIPMRAVRVSLFWPTVNLYV